MIKKFLLKNAFQILLVFSMGGALLSCAHVKLPIFGTYNSKKQPSRKLAAQLEPPRITYVGVTDSGKLLVRWNPVFDADYYEIYVGGISKKDWIPKSETEYTLNNASPNPSGSYEVTMKASRDESLGRSSSYPSAGYILSADGTSSTAPSSNSISNPSFPTGSIGNDTVDVQPLGPCLNSNACPGFDMTFDEDFKESTINPKYWITQLRWDGDHNGEKFEYRIINRESQFYVNPLTNDPEHANSYLVSHHNPFELTGSTLRIKAKANPFRNSTANNDHGSFEQMSKQQPFISGALSTYIPNLKEKELSERASNREGFSQRFGYFEARIKLPAKKGTFPAFWLHHMPRSTDQDQNGNWTGTYRTEIDVMEYLGHKSDPNYRQTRPYDGPDAAYNAFHASDTPFYACSQRAIANGSCVSQNPSTVHHKPIRLTSGNPDGQISIPGVNFGGEWHVYSVMWEPGKIIWYIDGQEVSRLNRGDGKTLNNFNPDREDLYILINLATGGSWANGPTYGGGMGYGPNEQFPTQNDINNFGEAIMEIDYVKAWKRR